MGRPIEYPSFRAQGHTQYWYIAKTVANSVGTIEERGVEIKADLTAEEAIEVRESIASSASAPAPKKRPKPEAVATSPRTIAAKKRRRDATSAKGNTQRKLKSLIDKTSNEQKSLAAKLPVMEQKGYPQAMVQWCNEKVNSLQPAIDAAQATYSAQVTKLTAADEAVDEIEREAELMDTTLQGLQQSFTAWKKDAVAEVSKLVG